MAKATRKKAQPLEETPAFEAALAALPEAADDLYHVAEQMELVFHDAMLAGDETALDDACIVFQAVIYKLNGGTFYGCKANSDSPARVLKARHTAKPGQVPRWGQEGEFLLTVTEGYRVHVRFHSGELSRINTVDLYAVDYDKPFPSTSGYWHHTVRVADHFGRSVAEAVRLEVEKLAAESGLSELVGPAPEAFPAWLKAALAAEADDGQLSMFADPPPKKKRGRQATGQAKTAAERAEAYRKRQKAKREAGELHDLCLTVDELDTVRAALGAYTDQNTGTGGFAPLAENLWRRLTCQRVGQFYEGDPVWSAEALKEDAERLRDALANVPRGTFSPDDFAVQWLSMRDRDLLTWARRNTRVIRNVSPEEAYPDDEERRNLLGKALNDMQTLSHRHHMLLQQARELSQMAFDAGLKPRMSTPAGLLRDLRAHSELYDVRKPLPVDDPDQEVKALRDEVARLQQRLSTPAQEPADKGLEELRRKVAWLERDNQLLQDERNKAFGAADVFQQRLRDSGLSTDYRRPD